MDRAERGADVIELLGTEAPPIFGRERTTDQVRHRGAPNARWIMGCVAVVAVAAFATRFGADPIEKASSPAAERAERRPPPPELHGHLPDGTAFTLYGAGLTRGDVVAARVEVAVESSAPDGSLVLEPFVAVTLSLLGSGRPLATDVVPSGPGLDWRIQIKTLDGSDLYGSNKVAVIDALHAVNDGGLPILDPESPFRLVDGSAEVDFGSLVVRSGCVGERAACSDSGDVHVVPGPGDPEVSISSP